MDIGTPQHEAIQVEVRRRLRAVRIAIAASLLVAILEIGFALWLNLESLLAEGIHTALDGVDSIIVFIAVVMAARPADRSHQYGHGKFEALGAAVEGAFVLVAGLAIGYRGIMHLVTGTAPSEIPAYICGVMALASVFYMFVSVHLMREARATRSPAILAEALHLRTHIYITGGIAVGLLIGYFGDWPIADTILAIAVAVCLVGISGHILKEVFAQFTDQSLPADEIEALGKVIQGFSDSFVEVHGIRTRQAGAERHIEMHLVVQPQTTVASAHRLAHDIEGAIQKNWPAAHCAIHIEPVNSESKPEAPWMHDQPKVRTDDATPDQREFIH